MKHSRRFLRGATMIELMVSLALLAVILSVTVGLLVGAIQNGARARVHSALARESQYLNTLLSNELRMAGLGVPPAGKLHIDPAYGTSAGSVDFDSIVIIANATTVGIVGDFPRPDAQYNTLGNIDNNPPGSRSRVMWHNEDNGSCGTNTSSTCTTSTTSMFFPTEAGCACTVTDRTCPWGMRRNVAAEAIQIVGGGGTWTTATIASPMATSTNGTNNNCFLNLSTTWNSVWPGLTTSDPPNAISGEGWVTTIDRVFYNYNSTAQTLERIQCYGDPDPKNANWPNAATTTLPAIASLAVTPTGGSVNTCIGPETVAKNVTSVAFNYFDSTGTAIATPVSGASKANITRIEWVIELSKTESDTRVRTAGARKISQDVVGTAGLRAFE